MPTLPGPMIAVLRAFAPLFSPRVWGHAQVLLVGAILAPAQRTMAALRVTGRAHGRQFHRYHRMLSRAAWSELAVGRVLLGLLVAACAPTGPLLFGSDETLERRRRVFHDPGKRIAAKGISRDPVRSSRSHCVKTSGLRWVCLMRLVPIPWAARTWALPILTALAPSERYDRERGRRHKTLTDRARPLLLVVRRWWPGRAIVAVADSTYAALEFLAAWRAWRAPVTVATRLRLDAALYEPAPPRHPGQTGRPRLTGPRQPTLAAVAADPATPWTELVVAQWYGAGPRTVEVASATAVWRHRGLPPAPLRWVLIRDPHGAFATQALLCTDLAADPAQVVAWFIQRWQLEVTFEEARRHLGLETQRQRPEAAIRRTTPVLLGLFSLVTLVAHRHTPGPGRAVVRQATWYRKRDPTFADALALVRRDLWRRQAFCASPCAEEMVKVPRALVATLTETLCYVA